ncbi:MAG: hypothetical protein IKM24_05225, partial [Clostridia bacterium]|nr:hypothetical protein [Clostridia bacterium]
IDEVSKANDQEANFDKISLYYVTYLFLNDQAKYLAGVGYDQETVLSLLNNVYNRAQALASSLTEVQRLQAEMRNEYDRFVANVTNEYTEAMKWQQINSSTRNGE